MLNIPKAKIVLTVLIFNLFKISLIFILASCGTKKTRDREPLREEDYPTAEIKNDKKDSEPCTVEQTETGAVISCPDGTTAVINHGNTGPEGPAGEPGQDAPICEYQLVKTCSEDL